MFKTFMAASAISIMLTSSVYAQTSDIPTGRSDSNSSGAMKEGDSTKTIGTTGMKSGGMKSSGQNGTSTLAGPAGKMADPANR